MKAEKDYLKQLLEQYLTGNYVEEDLLDLLSHFQQEQAEADLKALIVDRLNGESPDVNARKMERILQRLDVGVLEQTRPVSMVSGVDHRSRLSFRKKRYYLAAASVAAVLLLITTFYFLRTADGDKYPARLSGIIEPGGNRAYISTRDGGIILLSKDQEGFSVTHQTLVYDDGRVITSTSPTQLLVLHTPRAGQYRVHLPDGTNVWLNAESRLEYPAQFDEKERVVSLEGEAYFEVEPDPSRPFLVRTPSSVIQVLGTRFNVQVYDNEPRHHTTLMEGSVSITMDEERAEPILLKPDQQMRIDEAGIRVVDVDAHEYLVWTQGLIMLNNFDLAEVLRHLERWYDVDFDELPANIRGKQVFGSLQKDVPLQDVLLSLEKSYGIQFKINERRVRIVTNQD